MKRICLIMTALVSSVMLGSCEEITELETHFEVDMGESNEGGSSTGNGNGNGNGNTDGNGNGGGGGGITISIGFGDDTPPYDGEPIDYELIMPLDEMTTISSQGGDCWGDYFFQFGANYNKVQVYNLAQKKLVQTVYIQDNQKGFVPNSHMNTVCFGTEYYDPADQFPLIYVSTGNTSGGYSGALVYRIRKSAKESFSISLVQTIKFPVLKTYWTEFIPAGDCAYLCYPGERMVYQFAMPARKEGDKIIDPSNALETYQFPPEPEWMGSPSSQDRLFYHGRILYVTGLSQGFSGLVILNLEDCEWERIFNFKKNGLTSEPESIFVWQGDLCVACKDQIVKLISTDIP